MEQNPTNNDMSPGMSISQQMADKPGLVATEDTERKVKMMASTAYGRYLGQRTMIERIWRTADWMYKSAQNRAVTKAERVQGANLVYEDTDTERAQTGSTLFHRQVRQLAAQGASVQFSKDVPFKYSPIINDDNPDSFQKGEGMADQLNMLAKWTIKHSGFNNKSIDFWHQIFKVGNVPIMAKQIVKKGFRKIPKPVYEMRFDPDTQQEMAVLIGNEYELEEVITDNYPSIELLPVECVFADMYIGNIQGQNCVIVASLQNYSSILDGVNSGFYNQDRAKELLGPKYRWDGVSGDPLKQFRVANNLELGGDMITGQYRVWDVFIRAPIMNGVWDDDNNPPQICWATVVGNSIANGIILRLDENPDPDGEIPIEMIHCISDDPDLLYHVSPAQIIRSNYSVECTLKNQAIDNASLVNRPPLKEIEGEVRGQDREFTPGRRFIMERENSLTEFMVRDTTQMTTNLLDYIKQDSMQALSTDKPFMGESFGARTSAYEASNIYKNSAQPHMISIKYILDQYLGFVAKKFKSHWRSFSLPTQVVRITGEQQYQSIHPSGIDGEFDIEIDVVDEFEDDVVSSQKINEAIQIFGQNPAFAQVIDMAELAKEWFKRYKFDYSSIVKGRTDNDAETIAGHENETMIQAGKYVTPIDGQNHNVHLSVHRGERLRYKGLEGQVPTVQLLDQHIAQTEYMIQMLDAQVAKQQQVAENKSEGPGEMAGNEIAGAMGQIMGGG